MQIGLSLHPLTADARRIVSEDPEEESSPFGFLLIICTARIVTAHKRRGRVPSDTQTSQHTAEYCPAGYPAGRQHSYLRTVQFVTPVNRHMGLTRG